MKRPRIAFAAAVLGLLTLSARATVDSPIHRNFAVRDGGTLHVESDAGAIRVSPGAGGVAVNVKRHARNQKALDRVRITMEQRGNDVYVHAEADNVSRWFWWGDDLDLAFDVTVPAHYNADLKTSGGDVVVGDLHGFVRAKTSGGSLRVGRVEGSVEGRTSGGGVRLDGATGDATLHTSGGSITAGDIGGRAELRTSGGSIEIKRAGTSLNARTSGGGIIIGEVHGTVEAHTSGGSIRARIAGQPAAESTLTTAGGNIVVSLGGAVHVDLDAHTSGGGVETDIPITLLGHLGSETVAGKINGGGPRLVLRSSGGGIRVQKL